MGAVEKLPIYIETTFSSVNKENAITNKKIHESVVQGSVSGPPVYNKAPTIRKPFHNCNRNVVNLGKRRNSLIEYSLHFVNMLINWLSLY